MEISVLDPLVLLVLGVLIAIVYSRWLQPRNSDWYVFLGSGVIVAFWLHAAVTGLGELQPWLVAPATDVPISVGAFWLLAYPFWVRIGAGAIFLLTGRSPSEGGLVWAFRLRDRTEPFEPHWRK